jgi:hypothetical protein
MDKRKRLDIGTSRIDTGCWISPKTAVGFQLSAISDQRSALKGLFFNINRGIVNRKMKGSLAEAQRPAESLF